MSAVSGNTGAEIAVHRSGNWLYASNRGDNSIVRYAIGATGLLSDLQRVSVFGMTPRHFSLALNDTVMYVAKQSSGSIHAFRVSATDGSLTAVGEMATPPGPQFVGAMNPSVVLDRRAEPHVRQRPRKAGGLAEIPEAPHLAPYDVRPVHARLVVPVAPRPLQVLAHPLGALREHLERVPRREGHDGEDAVDEPVRHQLVE